MEMTAIFDFRAGMDCQQHSGGHHHSASAKTQPTSSRAYDQGQMRENISNSISKKKMSEFPSSGEIKPKNPPMKDVNKVNIYCTCRLPDNVEERMTECLVCLEWFHQTCLSLPTPLFKDPAKHKNWLCPECKENACEQRK